MTRQQIVDRLQPLARQIFDQPTMEITDNLSADNVPTWNSLTFTQFLTEVENTFGFKFKMMEILHLQNMGAIVDAVEAHEG